MKNIAGTVVLLAAFGVLNAHAQQKADEHSSHHAGSARADSGALTDGEVRRVDMSAKKITLRHAEIKSLDMPPMTMVFQVKDPAMLEQVKPGDKIRFSAEKVGGAYLLTRIEPVK